MTKPFATTTLLGLLLFGMITVAAWATGHRRCRASAQMRLRPGAGPAPPPVPPNGAGPEPL